MNYCYRADGGKFSALDADKTGLIYIGSLVYKQTAGSKIEFESAAFSDGRFRKSIHSWVPDYAPEYYLKDHLGSPRALCDCTGELIALRDYYPFGKQWDKPNAPVTTDLYHYNGKEEQTVGDAGLLDYGARFYHPDLGRWLTQDPMAEKFNSVSPYNFCLNNPIRYTDPFGLSPQSSRQIGVKDIYFDKKGRYLGRDNYPSDRIRIIERRQWEMLIEAGHVDENGMVLHQYAKECSIDFSTASSGFTSAMKPSAIEAVYSWIAKNFLHLNAEFKVSNSLPNNVLMRASSQAQNGNKMEQIIDVNHNSMASKNFCDNIFNILSVMVHEGIHLYDTLSVGISTYKSLGEEFQEWHAFTMQMINPFWNLATDTLRAYIAYSAGNIQKVYEL